MEDVLKKVPCGVLKSTLSCVNKLCNMNKRAKSICDQPNFKTTYLTRHGNGQLYMWGSGNSGKLGNGGKYDSADPILVHLNNVTFVACGHMHTAVVSNGNLYTFGINAAGQLGSSLIKSFSHTPVRVKLEENVIMAACGPSRTFAVTESGKVHVFGSGREGSMGLGGAVDRQNVPPTIISPLLNKEVITFIACGERHNAAITNFGKLYTWGVYKYIGRSGNSGAPKMVESLKDYITIAVACGDNHTAVIARDKYQEDWNLYTFGSNSAGQLGFKGKKNSYDAKVVEKLQGKNVTAVACGSNHTAVIANGQLYTFGNGREGQLFQVQNDVCHIPKRVKKFGNSVTHIACGGNNTLVVSGSAIYMNGLKQEYDLDDVAFVACGINDSPKYNHFAAIVRK